MSIKILILTAIISTLIAAACIGWVNTIIGIVGFIVGQIIYETIKYFVEKSK